MDNENRVFGNNEDMQNGSADYNMQSGADMQPEREEAEYMPESGAGDVSSGFEYESNAADSTEDAADGGIFEGAAYTEGTDAENAENADNAENGSVEASRRKKVHYNHRKSIAVGLAGTLICGAAMGFFFGVGVNTSKSIFDTAKNFSFSSQTASDDASKGVVNTSEDGSLVTSSDDVTKTVDSVKDSIVNINITAVAQDYFFRTTETTGSGSGIIYSEDDEKVYIVTNNHVVEDATSVTISITGEENIKASLVGKDASSDLAVIYVLKSDLSAAGIDSVKVAAFGDSDSVLVGESVVAIGNAMGLGKSATLGIISAGNKEINIDGKTLEVLQTDAAINPGNSGGALVNLDGEVIGINTAKLSSSAVEGTGYAIPTNVAKDVIQELMENGTIDRAYLGIQGSTLTDQIKSMYNISYDGVLVVKVEENSAAQQAGIQAYDIITSINGNAITSIEELSEQISACAAGDTVQIGIVRNGRQETTISVTLGSLNEQF